MKRLVVPLLAPIVSLACGAPAPGPAASPSAPAPVASASAAPAIDRELDPQPVPPEQRRDFEQRCKPLIEGIVDTGKKLTGPPAYRMQDALRELTQKPPAGLKEADRAFCFDVADRDMRGYIINTVGSAAKVTLGALGRRMKEVYERDKKLCPSTSKPVPADFSKLAGGAVAVTKDEWTGPAWECLLAPPMEKTLVQLEVKSDDAAGTFEIVARASPLRNGRVVEWVVAGRTRDGKLEVRPIERR